MRKFKLLQFFTWRNLKDKPRQNDDISCQTECYMKHYLCDILLQMQEMQETLRG